MKKNGAWLIPSPFYVFQPLITNFLKPQNRRVGGVTRKNTLRLTG
jgi:hypothetical protein